MAAALSIPRLVLGGVSSGVGKTTATLALARALRSRGLKVALFKCGPDYLDPSYHQRATGAPSQNLDGWMMGRDAVRSTFLRAAQGADIALIEGVMGLFDGASPTSEEGSTAEIAKWLEAPVVLLVDASGMARSLAALVTGFAGFDPALPLAGVLANRVGSRGHLDLLRKALKSPPLLGGLPRDLEHAFAERHLGLRTADEQSVPESLLEHWGALGSEWLSLDRLLEIARSAPSLTEATSAPEEHSSAVGEPASKVRHSSPLRCRIGLAEDQAFHFYYADNLRRLEELGAELVRFSPLHDETLPDIDGLYLGGGYPEVHAQTLADNVPMRAAIRALAKAGAPLYAECGGLMYLTQAIVGLHGERHEMVGLLPSEARMHPKLQALGYVEVELQSRCLLGEPGTRFRGHQFRYSELSPAPSPLQVEHVYSLRQRRGDKTSQEGYRLGNLLASYVHAHWASNPKIPAALVEACARSRQERS